MAARETSAVHVQGAAEKPAAAAPSLPILVPEGLLSLVGTPIGNLGDVSPRVREVLASADVVLCEDTRVTGRLLMALGIRATLERCDENVIVRRSPEVVRRLVAGDHVAFASDAGMPAISDPGQKLVDAALDAGVRVEVIPGPSALTCAVAASGIPCEHFFFEGFLPRKPSEQRRRLATLARIPGALVAYESPRRVAETLSAIAEVMPTRTVALARELTKVHEQVLRGPAAELAERVGEGDEVRGECVLVVSAPTPAELEAEEQPGIPLDDAIREGLAAGASKSALARELARTYPLTRTDVYARILELACDVR